MNAKIAVFLLFSCTMQAAHPDAHIGTKRVGSKPLVCFMGEAWDVAGSEHSRLRSLLLDHVRGQDVSKVSTL